VSVIGEHFDPCCIAESGAGTHCDLFSLVTINISCCQIGSKFCRQDRLFEKQGAILSEHPYATICKRIWPRRNNNLVHSIPIDISHHCICPKPGFEGRKFHLLFKITVQKGNKCPIGRTRAWREHKSRNGIGTLCHMYRELYIPGDYSITSNNLDCICSGVQAF